jgi:hypothetical protein
MNCVCDIIVLALWGAVLYAVGIKAMFLTLRDQSRTGIVRAPAVTSQTVIAEFSKISHLLCDRELRRPRTMGPTRDGLKRMAEKNPPPPEWFEGEGERPF